MSRGTAGARKDTIRVALVTASLEPGGAERQMLLLAELLPKDEFEIDFVCLKMAGAYADRALAAGARVRVLGLLGKRESGLPLPLYAGHLLRKVIRFSVMGWWGRYDVIDAWLYPAYALAALTRPFTRPRAVVAGRRSLSDFKEAFNLPMRLADALARGGVDRIIANSEAVKRDVITRERIPPDRIRVIHNGVQARAAMSTEERRRRREAWAASDATVVIGCVANYKPFKGLELLIRVTARLAADPGAPGLRLVLVGEGRLRPELEALRAALGVERSVILHGSEPEARSVYGAFDIAVHASEAEGLPNVVLEAAAAGLPIVATDAGGTREIVTDGATGLLVSIGDEDALAAAIDQLIRDPALRTRLGEAARTDVLARFGVERMVDEFAELYRELARR